MSLLQDAAVTSRLRHLCDTVVRLESFAGSDKEKNPAFREYHGEAPPVRRSVVYLDWAGLVQGHKRTSHTKVVHTPRENRFHPKRLSAAVSPDGPMESCACRCRVGPPGLNWGVSSLWARGVSSPEPGHVMGIMFSPGGIT